MRVSLEGSVVGLAALAAVVAAAPAAWAGCGPEMKQPASWQSTPGSSSDALLTKANFPIVNPLSIVGMWSVTFTAGGNVIDFGYSQWHSDGTEFLNSGGRAPSTQNFCLGVWKQTGAFSYHLNHLALSYDPSGTLNAKVQIKEDVILQPQNNTFSGPFSIDVFNPTSGALLQHVAGTVTGQRVTP
jgi:hypothetical protein